MRSVFCLCLLLGTLSLWSCGGTSQVPGGSGFIEATEIVVSSEVGGQLKALKFGEGDVIAQGDIIGEIDTVSTMLRLRQAQANKQVSETNTKTASLAIREAAYNLDLAGKEYDRVKTLIESGSVNQQQYDQKENVYRRALLAEEQAQAALEAARAGLAKAEAEISLLKKQLEDCFPRSPSSGVIITKFVEAGELIKTGTPLVKIAKLNTVWVKIYLPPEDLTRISLGGRALIDPEDGRTEPLEGRISWISEEAEFTPKNVQTKEARADLVYAVKITIPNPDKILKIGMAVSVKIQ